MDIATIKQRQQASWAAGDYSAVGARLLLTAELLCEAVDLRAGERVLDVACGNGNAALAAARRFCQVTGIDYVPSCWTGPASAPMPKGWRRPSMRAMPRISPSPTPPSTWSCPPAAPCSPPTRSRRRRAAAGLPARRADRHGQLGPRRLRRRAVPGHRPLPATTAGTPPPALWGSEDRLRELFGPGVSISAPAGPSCGAGRRPSTRPSSSPPSTALPTRPSRSSAPTAAPTSRPTWWR